MCESLLLFVPRVRAALRVFVGDVIPRVHRGLARRRTRRVVIGHFTQADQAVHRDAAVAQVVEMLAQVIHLLGQEFDHHGLVRRRAAIEFERCIQIGVNGQHAVLRDLRALGRARDLLVDAVDEPAQQVRVDGTDDRVRGLELAPVPGTRPHGAVALHDHLVHGHVREDRATMVLDAAHERLRELAAAALGDADAVLLEKAQEHEQPDTRPLLFRPDQVFTDHAYEMQPHAIVREPLGHDVPGAALHDVEHVAAFAALVHHRVHRAERRGR